MRKLIAIKVLFFYFNLWDIVYEIKICVWVPNKYNKTGDLDIAGEIKICVWVPNKYNTTDDLDIVDEIKICDWDLTNTIQQATLI